MGDEPARLAEIFAREKSRFLRFVRQQLFDRDEAVAEDIVSEVAFNLLRRGDVIGEIENLTAYFYRALANRVVDYRRGRIAIVRIEDREDESTPVEIPDERLWPDQTLEQHELRSRLFKAIGELAPKERAVWLATEVDGRSFRDLAEEWGEPIGTLLSRKSRASATLRRLLSDYRNR
jgi:RNA polymerase sigma factor (sigma-70 family)